jgi:spermidine/putrescine transport system substrate-binding protein
MARPADRDPEARRNLARRDLLGYAGLGGGAVTLAGFLEACGVSGNQPGAAKGSKLPNAGLGTKQWWAKQKLHHHFSFANWPEYIDTSHGRHPSLDLFKRETGITVDYSEAVNDNNAFYAKIQPALKARQYTGFDLIVTTTNDPPLGFYIENGYLVPLDHAKMTNFYRYADPLARNPAWDPGNRYTMAYQSGWTILAYNTQAIHRPIDSWLDLWDPSFKGKVGMMSIPSETGAMALLATGKNPPTSTPADWRAAAKKLQDQKPLVRGYWDASYIEQLKQGNTWISMAWSGDIFQANLNGYTHLKPVMPKEGGLFWTDSMCIPYTARNPLDAMTYMDYAYRPGVQAMMDDYINYVSPVPAARKIILSKYHDRKVADSPWVFTSAEFDRLARFYPTWKHASQVNTWNSIFEPIFES